MRYNTNIFSTIFFKIFNAFFISIILDAPLEIKTGFFVLPIALNKGKLFISADATLKWHNFFKAWTNSKSKGVETKLIFLL